METHASSSMVWRMPLILFLSALPAISQAQPANVNVSNANLDQNETTIAINPLDSKFVVGGSNYAQTNSYRAAYYYSTNAGVSWSQGLLPQGGDYDKGCDPSVCFDRLGNVYYGHLSMDNPGGLFALDNGVFINKSTNNGVSWLTNPLTVWQNGDGNGNTERTIRADKPYLTCDAVIGSSFQNNVYISWTMFFKNSPNQIFMRRLNAGGSFGDTIRLTSNIDTNIVLQGSVPAVGPTGVLYVVWCNRSTGSLQLRKSTDGGSTFSSEATIVTGIGNIIWAGEHMTANSYPSIAVDNSGGRHSGNVYVVWADRRNETADIFMTIGTPTTDGGLSWDSASIVNQVARNDQWSPWVTVASNGVVHVVWYDARAGNDTTDTYVASSWDGGQTFRETAVTSASFNPRPGLGDFIGDYNGIAASPERVLPFWTGTHDLDEDVYVALFDQGALNVVLNQKKEDGTTDVGMIGRWNYNSFNPPLSPGTQKVFVYNTEEVLHGDTNAYGFQKYHDWGDPPDVRNHHSFTISEDFPVSVTSRFKLTYSATLQSQLIEGGGGGGNVQLRDPWFVDVTDPLFFESPFGYRNLGNDAPYKAESSPLYIYSGSKYKGVFLLQGYPSWNPPYYSVGALSSQTIAGFTSYFLKWSGSSTAFQDSLALQTPVVFTSGNAVATANYKAHLASSSSFVTSPTAQRKGVRDSLGYYHMAYTSGEGIFYTRDTTGNLTWGAEKALGLPTAGSYQRSPCITVQTNPHRIFAAWDVLVHADTAHYINWAALDPSSGTIQLSGTISWTGFGLSESRPVIASGDSSGSKFTLVVWYDSASHALLSAVRKTSTGDWSPVATLRTSVVSAFSVSPTNYLGEPKWHLVWVESNKLHFAPIPVASTPALGTTGVDSIVATAAPDGGIFNPSVTDIQYPIGQPAVAWEDFDGEIKHVIKYRQHDPRSGGSWGTTQVFSKTSATVNYVTPTLSGHPSNANVTIAWRDGTSQLKFVQRRSGSWGSQTNFATGFDPTSSVGQQAPGSEVLLYRGTTTPYPILQYAVNYGQQKANLAGLEPEGRGGNLLFASGKLGLALKKVTLNDAPLSFVAMDDTIPVTTMGQFLAALRSESFTANGTLDLDIALTAFGALPGQSGLRLAILDASTNQRLAVIRQFGTSKDSVTNLLVPLSLSGRSVRLAVEVIGTPVPLSYELERWHMMTEGSAPSKLEAGGGQVIVELFPKEFALRANFPNPFNPTTTFNFELPQSSTVRLVIYDLLGQELEVLTDGTHEAGYHSVVWDARSVASGVYYARFTASDESGKVKYSKVNKLLLMK